ncbi:MAG: PorT family protein [Bacteroidetes bacterium]|nr:PorT family protein [Bacteroidota bacterium]
MIARSLFILQFIFLSAKITFAQVEFSFGPEVGVSTEFLSRAGRIYTSSQYSSDKTYFTRPLAGVGTEFTIKKHLRFGTGIQYELIGYHEQITNSGQDNSGTWNREENFEEHFTKLCMPVTAGFVFQVNQLRFHLFAGYRLNYFVNGNYHHDYTLNSSNDSLDDYFSENTDPFSKSNVLPMTHFHSQLCGGLSVAWKNFEFTAMCNRGRPLYFSKYVYIMCMPGEPSMQNDNYTFTVRYNFTRLKEKAKEVVDCPHY